MLELFLETDFERGQYRILAALQRLRSAFRRSALYPTLKDVEEIHAALVDTVKECERLRDSIDEPHLIEALMRWALPRVEDVLEEGYVLRDFAAEQCTVEEVGIVPAYTNEGFLILEDVATTSAYRYRLLTTVRSLQIQKVLELESGQMHASPVYVKLRLLEEHPDLPQAPAFAIYSHVELPFTETILPVACQLVADHIVMGH